MFLPLLPLLFTFLIYSRAIPLKPENGILYRFSPTSSNETDELLAWAELREWDLWQISPSHVDIYFPHPPVAEAGLDLFPPYLLPTARHQIESQTPSCAHAGCIKHASSTIITERRWDLASLSNATFHSRYHPLGEIHSFVRDLADAYPHQVSVIPLGHSGEGREMFALEITSGASGGLVSHDQNSQVMLGKKGNQNGANPRCGFLITGAQHAREWVATASALYIAHALLADSSEEFSLARLLERHNFYIIPVPNPDGYAYTWDQDRFWYKNRLQFGPQAGCVGIDMNRNWGYKWKAKSNGLRIDKSVPTDPCSHWYPGNRPFQAPEVNNMENYFSRLPRLKGFLDLRSYGQMLSTPFSYSCKQSPKDAEDQLEAISGAAHAMKKSHGTVFTTGSLCSTLYRAPGNIVDWVYKKMGVKYSFAAHLRDTGTYGFALPEQWIRPVGEETTRMVEYLGDFIANKECR
ncbi:hypothetical protein B0F90DRAFT_1846663 [Multifurca ochricompacta]|uniref:Peptidase M14 domain-containing protein n=1 Tax=Multifurca ochricompacta TaxID=376703 RepID=A0AAD4M3G7_9AGAM|nr:hypothetical protein B0F90DRAFT_1846663 [Multifurca ochricompacta]